MRVLHVSLGLPPYRSGGLTNYSYDLMLSQQKQQKEIFLLFPGHYSPRPGVRVVRLKEVQGIRVFEIVNPLPVCLMGGIKNPAAYVKPASKKIFLEFLKSIKPIVIHLHTIMGIPREFLEAARELTIRIIFTTHDYYGICPRVNLINWESRICLPQEVTINCALCNQQAYHPGLVYFLQTKLYRACKQSSLIKFLGKFIKRSYLGKNSDQKVKQVTYRPPSEKLKLDFAQLKDYWQDLFSLVDRFHFNSSVTAAEYHKYLLTPLAGRVINIIHSQIVDRRSLKDDDPQRTLLRIGYIGSDQPYKGLALLEKSISRLLNEGLRGFRVHLFGDICKTEFNADIYQVHGPYQSKDLAKIFAQIDVLIIPSIWKETFGLVGLEAFAYGVLPCVSENVGFQDVLQEMGLRDLIFKPEVQELSDLLKKLIFDKNFLERVNNLLQKADFNFTMTEHLKKIDHLYYN